MPLEQDDREDTSGVNVDWVHSTENIDNSVNTGTSIIVIIFSMCWSDKGAIARFF